MDTLTDEKLNDQRFKLMRSEVHKLGCAAISYFGDQFAFEGGYWLQQNPDEFTALILFLQDHRPHHSYLEIGVAAGGTALTLYQLVGFDNVFLIDDGKHPQCIHQKELLDQIPGYKMFVGDSHSALARQWMIDNVHDLSIVFIDGDHSVEGVYQDVKLALQFSRPGTIITFHDMVISTTGVKKVWNECIHEGLFAPLAIYIGKKKPMGIGIASVI